MPRSSSGAGPSVSSAVAADSGAVGPAAGVDPSSASEPPRKRMQRVVVDSDEEDDATPGFRRIPMADECGVNGCPLARGHPGPCAIDLGQGRSGRGKAPVSYAEPANEYEGTHLGDIPLMVGADRPPAGAPPNLPLTSLVRGDRVRCRKGSHKGKFGVIDSVKDGKVRVKFDPIPPSATGEVSKLQLADKFEKM
ncbi:hypothetical protein EMIHUDRAFT_438743 [Emiliania huxleyi CCMP1516]|uniref:KOW domain-containing protein n=2 Tax=Emiliania huxleyi TaxID=2903 RepID=A0A0D3I587_EMIH1|nr:hypothetical protein EMIHUDRAFT_438743 [Emiliania huxleyi CCMP1516]EOD06422.1 hypothetical protein EMIHUDRAFT_438743 [Emiliania huxleyi CCMP1516]|eukprot:XP_005758851.1 hypothetical protein EMIHUDRAFT_438743 [Emiliania huxleyi CCMP1516]